MARTLVTPQELQQERMRKSSKEMARKSSSTHLQTPTCKHWPCGPSTRYPELRSTNHGDFGECSTSDLDWWKINPRYRYVRDDVNTHLDPVDMGHGCPRNKFSTAPVLLRRCGDFVRSAVEGEPGQQRLVLERGREAATFPSVTALA